MFVRDGYYRVDLQYLSGERYTTREFVVPLSEKSAPRLWAPSGNLTRFAFTIHLRVSSESLRSRDARATMLP